MITSGKRFDAALRSSRDNQRHIDDAVPIFFGGSASTPGNEINTSAMMNQTKNQAQAADVFVHPGIAEVKSSHSVLTLGHGAWSSTSC